MSADLPVADAPVRVALVGYGRMGHEIERLAPTSLCVVTQRFDLDRPVDPDVRSTFDVAIEFTHPTSVVDNIRTLVELGVPTVVGTTGWSAQLADVTDLVKANDGRLIYASNFSVGVLAFTRIVAEAARVFDALTQYDAAVHEAHHAGKADSPSGTALSLAREVLQHLLRKSRIEVETRHDRIDPADLHVTSTRVGSVVGTHSVVFDSPADTVELVHRAKDRSGFALGALLAARWIVSQPAGVYRFEEVF